MGDLGTSTTLAFIAGPVIGVVVLRRVLRSEPDPVIAKLLVLGLAAKLAGTAAYYFVVAEVWGGGDVARYVREGRNLVGVIRSGTLPDQARETGTPFMEFLTGVVFSAVGPNEIAGYLAFSMLAFVGMYLFLQAFRLALPGANHRRYAFLLLLMPTMLFWPSTIGKESWLVFALGIAAFGAARVLRRERFGYLVLGTGLLAIGAVRPHVAALFAVSFLGAYLLRLMDRGVRQNALAWGAGLVVVTIGAVLVLTNFSEEMGKGESEGKPLMERIVADTDELFERTDENTQRGGGEFESRPVRTPADFVHAAITVPFRPFITEAHSPTAQLSSLEAMLLLVLVLLALPRLLTTVPSTLMRQPYLALAVAYSIGFVIAFSNIANFGLLVRYRAMLLPFMLVPLCLARRGRSPATVEGGRYGSATPTGTRASGTRLSSEADDGAVSGRSAGSGIPTPPRPPVS